MNLLAVAKTQTVHQGSSVIGTVLHPIFVVVGYVLAQFYGVIPNYAAAISLLTIAVMIVVFPLTRLSARSMMRMQLLSPEMKRIQARYKAKPGTPATERAELRQKMNEEVMALYRENGVNPTGGCLPMFLQFPILIVLYDVVRGLSHQSGIVGSKLTVATPQNIPVTSRMYHDLVLAHGQMHVLGINLADSVRSPQPSVIHVLPYAVLVLIAVGLQYVSIWQVTTRNPAAQQANPQMQAMQKFMPLIFLVLYIALPAGVGVYFVVSSLFRIGQQEWMYKRDPTIVAAIQELQKRKSTEPPAALGAPKTLRERMREAREGAGAPALNAGTAPGPASKARPTAKAGAPPAPTPSPKKGAPPPQPSGGAKPAAAAKNGTRPSTASQSRSRAKRRRKG